MSSSGTSETDHREDLSLTLLPTVFATLAVSSIEEDTYGYVQQVLPATMEAIVRYRSALVSLQNELVMAASSLGPSSAAGAEESRLLVAVPIGGEHIHFPLVRLRVPANRRSLRRLDTADIRPLWTEPVGVQVPSSDRTCAGGYLQACIVIDGNA